ncbi:MAG TPA: histidine phosphatase family protein [Tepidisphaeraceae bacterium]|jgi:probable phosphoglycerate mutase
MQLPLIYLARHGETDWSLTGQHTGRTDLPLTPRGERNAARLSQRLRGISFSRVVTSPLQRAFRTCQLAGYGTMAEVDPDLVEWDYGRYEGLRSAEIRQDSPGWNVFLHGAPGGESVADVRTRAQRVVHKLRADEGNTLVFSSGHFLRALAATWLGLDVSAGRLFALDTAALSCLGYEHTREEPVMRFWNDTNHAAD